MESVTTWASSGLVCSGLFLLVFTGAEDCWGPRSGTGLNKSAFMAWHEVRCAAVKQPVSIKHSGINDQFVSVYMSLCIALSLFLWLIFSVVVLVRNDVSTSSVCIHLACLGTAL